MDWYENIKPTIIYNDIGSLLSNNQNLYSEEVIIFLVNNDNGMGSNLTIIVNNSLYLKNINPKLHVLGHFSNNGYNFKYHDIQLNNSFFLYFKYLHDIPEKMKYYFVKSYLVNYEFIQPQRINGLNVDDIIINKKYSEHFKKNFKVKNSEQIINNINNIKEITKIPLIGIHIRSFAQILIETPNINNTIENRILKLKNELDTKYNNYNIFLTTDVHEYIIKCKNIFKETNVKIYYNDFISRINDDGNGINGNLNGYKDSMIYLSEYSGFKLGSDIINDCVSLINCDKYYTSITNIAFITSFINDKNNGIHYN